jgi:DNA invertase Pin-like site-specific DNA recombinase
MIHILAAFAELERSFISERTRDGLAARKRKKTQYCHYPGYGFRWEKSVVDGRRVRVKVPDEEEPNVMRSILALRTQPKPLSWHEITEHFAKLGIVSKEGRSWTEIRVRRACKAELLLQRQEPSTPEPEPVI